MSEIIKQINVDGVDYNIVSESAEKKIAEIDEKIKGLEGNTSDELTKITYSELKALRDNGELLEGHLYRITDYVTTTVQRETKSANHPFDIIVTALSANTLDEKASAIAHEGDTYFDGNDLGAWELWYDMDNDTAKFEWADATNGKGVIYRMIDEKYNDCPYDFKNILFYNNEYTNLTAPDNYYFTFSYVVNGILYDGTVEKQVTSCYGNEMGAYIKAKGVKCLNKNVFKSRGFDWGCHNNTFGYNCYNNTFDYNCYKNTFGYNCHSNYFASSCYNNTFGSDCQHRKLDAYGTSITLNDEYYDDRSGKLVPIKHPDLSTQPSILPYKFMGQYVYEQLIPVTIAVDSYEHSIHVNLGNYGIEMDRIVLLETSITGEHFNLEKGTKSYLSIPIKDMELYYDNALHFSLAVYLPATAELTCKAYLHIVYTSMPEEVGYYGYENY